MTVLVGRRESFNAAHQLCDPGLSDEENRRLFGKCANLHGHNYVLEVVVAGEVDQASGYVLDLKLLSDVMSQAGHPGRGSPQPEYRRAVAQGAHPHGGKPGPELLGAAPAWSCPTGCCGRCGCGRPIRTGRRSVSRAEAPARAGRDVQKRYTAADLRVLTRDEASRFDPHGDGDPQTDVVLAWELLYRLEPELYDRLASAERLHPGVVGWLPRAVERIAEVGAGTGRLTLELIDRGREVVAVEPAAAVAPDPEAEARGSGSRRPGPGDPRVFRPAAAA